MKKLIFLFLALLLLTMTSAAMADGLRIGVMSGPTGMGMAKLMADEAPYTYEIYSAPTGATADLASGALDLLCLPTNTAAAMAAGKDNFIKVLAVNCLGSLYLLSDGTVQMNDIRALDGQTIYAGVKNSTTGPILENIFDRNDISATIEWEADHDAVVAQMLQGNIHLAVLPEPKATVAMTKADGWQIALNISEEWDKVIDTRLPMGCIVVRESVLNEREAEVTQFMADYAASIACIANAENRAESAAMIANAGILPAAGIAQKALMNLDGSIVYMDGAEMKETLCAFYAAIGMEQPADSFFYLPNE